MEFIVLVGVGALAGWLWLAYRCIMRGRWRSVVAAIGAGAAVLVVGAIVAQPIVAWQGTGGLEELGTGLLAAIVVLAAAVLTTVVILVRGAFDDERPDRKGSTPVR